MERTCSGCGRLIPSDSKICPYCSRRFSPIEMSLNLKKDEKKDDDKKIIAIIAIVIIVFMIVPVIIAAPVYVYVNSLIDNPYNDNYLDSPSLYAVFSSKDDTNYTVTYEVLTVESEIPWSQITAEWDYGECEQINSTDGKTALTGDVEAGDYFSINLNKPGNYEIYLTYEGYVLWLSPSISVGDYEHTPAI